MTRCVRSSARLEPERRARLLGVLVVVAIALATSANVLGNGFVFDDLQNILQNPWCPRTSSGTG